MRKLQPYFIHPKGVSTKLRVDIKLISSFGRYSETVKSPFMLSLRKTLIRLLRLFRIKISSSLGYPPRKAKF